MNFIKLGEYNHMTVVKKVDFGLYLDGGDEGEILLPKRYVPQGCKVGDELDVFVYLDNEERPVATTLTPKAKTGDFAYLKVAWVNNYGAFLDWGLMKDLFCPFREQKIKMEKDFSYIVHVHIDEDSYRIVASAKVEQYIDTNMPPHSVGDEVNLLVWQRTDLGYKVIVDNRYAGLVYKDQIFKKIHIGDRMKGYVSAVRPDGKLDIMLQPTGRKITDEFSVILLDYIKIHNGVCYFTDKSNADDIYKEFQVSKKNFKKAVGDLYKKRLITIEDNCLRMV